ncbi:DUF397 domain-containing protein [Streptomyces sp. NPDC051776]|uniref:DUF397 domain-containing protein n=1 Tax=Streptomyces sp. NPDC051776 TaxID=3155414 RepID=UPI0034458869
MNSELAWFTSSYSSNEGGNCVEVAFTWRKSSYSDNEGGACVEVAYDWHKSSYSNNEGGECVEVATAGGTVHVRDSKDRSGPSLAFSGDAWADFLAMVSDSSTPTA